MTKVNNTLDMELLVMRRAKENTGISVSNLSVAEGRSYPVV